MGIHPSPSEHGHSAHLHSDGSQKALGLVPGGLRSQGFRGDAFGDLCNLPIEYDTIIVHLIAEYYPRWRALEVSKKVVGMTVWETDTLQAHWRETLNRMDTLLVRTH
jgi:hypothetical protein